MSSYIYGTNSVRESLKKIKSGTLYIQNTKKNNTTSTIIDTARNLGFKIIEKDRDFFFNQFPNKTHQGIALKTDEKIVDIIDEGMLFQKIKNLKDEKILLLILDGVTDVGNLGAILRSALLFNTSFVILPKNNSATITDTVIAHSAGAVFQLTIVQVNNLVRVIQQLKNNEFWIYALDKSGTAIQKVDFASKTALVFGSEHKGLRPLVKKNCDQIVTIPTSGLIDSLNVSVSVAVTLYQVSTQLSK